jgi:hypothetical protein
MIFCLAIIIIQELWTQDENKKIILTNKIIKRNRHLNKPTTTNKKFIIKLVVWNKNQKGATFIKVKNQIISDNLKYNNNLFNQKWNGTNPILINKDKNINTGEKDKRKPNNNKKEDISCIKKYIICLSCV